MSSEHSHSGVARLGQQTAFCYTIFADNCVILRFLLRQIAHVFRELLSQHLEFPKLVGA